ncbi:ABC transporter substrate-binding protein [Natronobiforma cellulositropha]|uniref:substrate-binding domain-containing protein n=1 Tax=Natronobiforma cellulositropha TaxID=1679076 RepID=UPI0021D59EB9|nr:substrate-binding domain-containing protein [Natronobiforma cellulositropha]
MNRTRRAVLAAVGGASVSVGGCLSGRRSRAGGSWAGTLTVAVTTSTYDAGLARHLHGAFETAEAVRARTVSAGSGETIAAGRRGDVDVVMAHARALEEEFLAAGYATGRYPFASGDFVLCGPPDDPAGAGEADGVLSALERIYRRERNFLSRGDGSGTHHRERDLWETVGIDPAGEWYTESGSGMGETVLQASQRGAYLLAVRANIVAMRSRVDLAVHVEGPTAGGDRRLENIYSFLPVNPAVHPHVESDLAERYVDFLAGERGRALLEEFAIEGESVFVPHATENGA